MSGLDLPGSVLDHAPIGREPLPDVLADPTLLTEIYQNLIGNALKFVAKGKPVIRLTAVVGEHGCVLGVRDNGIGVAPEHAGAIFEPFRRLHGPEEYAGTGIGLSICRKAVERHGGRIWLESEPAGGSHVRFTLGESLPAKGRVSS
jgi:signal transduction histidine kinase